MPLVTADPPQFEASAKQSQLWQRIMSAPADSMVVIGYGGAAGGGKTRALAELAFWLALANPGTRILVGRKHYEHLRTTTMEEFYRVVPRQFITRQHGTEHWCALRCADWPAGVSSRVFFRGLEDWTALLSEEFGAVLIDEAGEVSEQAALSLLSRLRHPAQVLPYVFVAATNPWPGWFKRWFIDRQQPGTIFIQAKMADNPHLPPNYEAELRARYPQDWVSRFIEGDFGAFVGQVHPDLSPALCWRGPIPEFSLYVGGLDFGGQNPWDHMSAGVIAGVATGKGGLMPKGAILRIAHFEDRGAKVYDNLLTWIGECEGYLESRVQWCADKTQMWGIDQAARLGLQIKPSHGGPDSVDFGIGLQNRRFAAGTGLFLPELLSPPSPESAARGARSWYERMEAYHWAEPRDDEQEAKRQPVKRDDDTPNADRYMHEAVDGWPPMSRTIARKNGRRPMRSYV